MERESNPWEKFWGARALELWKSFPLGHEGLAIALVKGKTLFGQKKLILIKKMGLPDGDKVESFYWSYRLSGINSSNEYHLQIIFDKEDMVSETVIEN